MKDEVALPLTRRVPMGREETEHVTLASLLSGSLYPRLVEVMGEGPPFDLVAVSPPVMLGW